MGRIVVHSWEYGETNTNIREGRYRTSTYTNYGLFPKEYTEYPEQRTVQIYVQNPDAPQCDWPLHGEGCECEACKEWREWRIKCSH